MVSEPAFFLLSIDSLIGSYLVYISSTSSVAAEAGPVGMLEFLKGFEGDFIETGVETGTTSFFSTGLGGITVEGAFNPPGLVLAAAGVAGVAGLPFGAADSLLEDATPAIAVVGLFRPEGPELDGAGALLDEGVAVLFDLTDDELGDAYLLLFCTTELTDGFLAANLFGSAVYITDLDPVTGALGLELTGVGLEVLAVELDMPPVDGLDEAKGPLVVFYAFRVSMVDYIFLISS